MTARCNDLSSPLTSFIPFRHFVLEEFGETKPVEVAQEERPKQRHKENKELRNYILVSRPRQIPAMARKIPPPREVPDPPECQVGHKGGQEGRQQTQTEQDADQGMKKCRLFIRKLDMIT